LWTQGEILPRTRASGGLVSRIIQYLISHGYIDKASTREFRVGDPLDLLDAWAAGDRPDRLGNPTRFSCSDASPVEIARRLQDFYSRKVEPGASPVEARVVGSALEAVQRSLVPFKGACPALLLTHEIAASLRCPQVSKGTVAVAAAYVSYLPTQRQMETLGLRPVTEGGNVWLFLPRDEGIFLETQTVDGLTLTTDAQICLDLQASGAAGSVPATAEALRAWEGFCRP
jgi:hypothetical protein